MHTEDHGPAVGWAPDAIAGRDGAPAVVQVRAACRQMARLVRRLPATDRLAAQARGVAEAIIDACDADVDAARGAIRLIGRAHPYVVRHPLHVAIVAQLLARHQGMDELSRRSLAGAAVTMNLSITRLQERLYAQASPPDAAQRQALRAHPQASAQMLEAAGIADSRWLRMVREHHERLDGSGYPAGIGQEGLDPGSRILLFADYFCARLATRSYRRGLRPEPALRQIFFKAPGVAARPDAQTLIWLLGLYPPGSFVRLANGEAAVIVRRGAHPDQPLALSLAGPDGRPLPAPQLRDTGIADCTVAATVGDEEVTASVPPERIWPATA